MSTQLSTSSGKVILSGEQSAVVGEVAIVSSISLKISVEVQTGALDPNSPFTPFFENIVAVFSTQVQPVTEALSFSVTGELPIGSGLGSSAAIAHASFKGLAQRYQLSLTVPQLFELVQLSEQFAHGSPSGMDALAVTTGGLLKFQRTPQGLSWQPVVSTQLPELPFYLIQSGIPVESTKEMVAAVLQRHANDADTQALMKEVGALTAHILEQVSQNSFEASMIKENQRLLERMGIVGKKAQAMVKQIEAAGGVAKVTGAGGVGDGSGMLLALHSDQDVLHQLIQTQNWESYPIRLGME